jgi:enterochelin esterase family protein
MTAAPEEALEGRPGLRGGSLASTLRILVRWRMFRLLVFSLALAAAFPVSAADEWKLHRDATEKPEVPKGTVKQMPPWLSKVFPQTTRDWWIYVPAQYKPDRSAALMIFQDGGTYVSLKGMWRVPTVFDNLIAEGAMPPTVAVFLSPGSAVNPGHEFEPGQKTNRSIEYDSLGDRYARFLLEEIIPEVEKQWPLSPDPEMHAICGASSGGICAFTVAWERPEAFRKVLSTIGSFTNIRGGNAYPSLIRKTEPKTIRVYLADSSGDVDNLYGSWPIANQQMSAALKYMKYDVRFDYVEGYKHSSEHGGSIFPDAVRWLWRKN